MFLSSNQHQRKIDALKGLAGDIMIDFAVLTDEVVEHTEGIQKFA